ncbi:MAG: tRNA uridine-5-carboxymethylaminomethyl(34) synthesis GTPase MnmE [Verrucomicrobiales bacterium]
MKTETIAALATAGGTGAVALIRVSGAEAAAVVAEACGCGVDWPDRRAQLRTVRVENGAVIDKVVVTFFQGPRSYTGEPVAEVSTHGGRFVTRKVLDRILACGARSARPGEFTERAFFNGKLDLTQAEAVMDLISAQSELALRAAHEQLDGRLGQRTENLRGELIGVVAQLEAWIDFPEEDIDPATGKALQQRMASVREGIGRLLATADQGRVLREGLRTVICGLPNAGKSSLLNALLGENRAIVSDAAGTTRDTIEELLVVDGIPLRVVDTAGLREAEGVVEQEGIRRTRKEAERADLLIVVADASLSAEEALPQDLVELPRMIRVLNKTDLGIHPSWSGEDHILVSCVEETGLEELRGRIRELAEFGQADWGEHSVAINARHRDCLKGADDALSRAAESLATSQDAEIVAIELRESLDLLGEIAGRVDTEEILGSIFSQFCIGK